jgi:hypothetical protein
VKSGGISMRMPRCCVAASGEDQRMSVTSSAAAVRALTQPCEHGKDARSFFERYCEPAFVHA